jgi:hypothetical protein
MGPLGLLSVSLGACASMAVTTDKLEERTAWSTGMAVGTFTITDRKDDGVRTDYLVKGQDGRAFRCTVGGSFSVLGRVVTDALCTQTAGKVINKPESVQDNALTREYRKLQKP